MIKRISLAVCLLLIALCAFAEADVTIDEQNFPDPVFREYVRKFDKDGNGSFNEDELYDVFDISVSNMGISSLKGIEYFGAVMSVDASNNTLTEVDLSYNPLSYILLENNQLTKLDVSQNKFLLALYCSDNQLTSLKLGNPVALDKLSCAHNALETLDVSGCPKLEKLIQTSTPGFFEPNGRNYFGWFQPQSSAAWPTTCLFADKGIKIIISSGTIDTANLPTDTTDNEVTVSGGVYQLNQSKKTATFVKATNKKTAKLTIMDTVSANGNKYKVTEIKAGACKGMGKLQTLTIGKNIKDIGKGAFQNCKKLKTITIKTKDLTAKTVKGGSFKGINSKATFKCPKGKANAYKKLFIKAGAPKTCKFK